MGKERDAFEILDIKYLAWKKKIMLTGYDFKSYGSYEAFI